MEVGAFLRQSRVLIVAGKGGVGKTTMVAALAHLAAETGLSALVVELEGRTGVPAAFGSADPLGYAGAVLRAAGATVDQAAGEDDAHGGHGPLAPGEIRARTITPDDALLEYLADHGLRRVSKRLVSSGIVDLVAGAIPGIKDVLVLGKIKQIERSGQADVVVVDAPATGHALTFLTSASGLVDAARGGPVRTQAQDVVDLLTDPARCQVVLVTLPEEMPVNEAVDAAYALEDRVGVALGPVVVNACLPDLHGLSTGAGDTVAAAGAGATLDPTTVAALEAARSFRVHRQQLQAEQLARLARELPLAQLRVPALFTAAIGPAELDQLAAALAQGIATLPDPVGAAS